MKKIKQTLLAPLYMLCAGALVVSSCISEANPFASSPSDQETEEDGMGSFEVQLQGNDATRATTPVSADDAKKYWITIYRGADVYTPATQLEELSSRLNAGYGYSLMAESITEAEAESLNDGWGKRRYMGKSQSFAIVAGQTTKVPVSCKVANGGVSAYFDNTITSNFTNYSITINEKFADETERKIVFDGTNSDRKSGDDLQSGNVAYFNIPEAGRTIEYTVTAGSVNKTFTQELEVAKIKRLSVSYKSGDFTLSIEVEDEEIYIGSSVTIEPDPSLHDNAPVITTQNVYDNGVLMGTTLSATDPAYDQGQVEWSAVVRDAANGDVIRTLSPAKGTLVSGADDAAWPYLPVGNYVLEYTFENLRGVVVTETEPFSITVQPNFQVSLNALTSYSYATGDGTAKDIAQANACANNMIYAPTVTVTGLSDALIANTNYGFTTKFNNETKYTKVAAYADYTVSENKAYNLSASTTFAGRTVTANKTVYVTGLPYSANPPTTSNGWSKTKGTVVWEDTYVRLGNAAEGSEERISKSFYAPGNVNVSAYVKAEARGATVGTDFKFYVGGEEKLTKSAGFWGTESAEGTVNGTLTTSNSTVECSNSYGLASTHSRVYTVRVQYR